MRYFTRYVALASCFQLKVGMTIWYPVRISPNPSNFLLEQCVPPPVGPPLLGSSVASTGRRRIPQILPQCLGMLTA